MVPCHKCHPGTAAWAAPARWPDLMVGKVVLRGFSHPDSSFPQPLGAAQHSPASLQFPWLAQDPGEGGPQPLSWVRPKGGSLPTLFGRAAAPTVPGKGPDGQRCPLAAQSRTGHGLARLPDLIRERLGKESWHGLVDVGEQVGTYLLFPPQSQAGPCLNHMPVCTWEGAALPRQC